MRHARSIWCMTSSYSKTSGFVRPNVNEKPAFSKISTLDLRAFLKRCVLGDRFYQIRVDGRPDWGIKYPFSSSDRCGRAKNYFFFYFFYVLVAIAMRQYSFWRKLTQPLMGFWLNLITNRLYTCWLPWYTHCYFRDPGFWYSRNLNFTPVTLGAIRLNIPP